MEKIGQSIIVENAYALATYPGLRTSSCFMTFRNLSNETDWLKQVKPDKDQPFSMAMPMTFAIDNNGTWSMITLKPNDNKFFEIAPGVPTVLTPGYAHIMIMDIDPALKAGRSISLHLHFVNSGEGNIKVPIVESI